MSTPPDSKWLSTGTALAVWIALGTVVVHLATGWRYGFDRDELMALEDARHLAWGYVQYPPVTAFLGRVELELFGTSLVGFRFFAALAQAFALLLTGLMAKELGGGKWAQVVATLAGVPFCLGAGALMQYINFDYVCWVWVAYCAVRVLKDEDARWCLGAGAGIGLGMMAKYTMAFLAVGVVLGVLATEARKYLRSVCMWLGVLLACAIFAPNFVWEWRRNFVSLDFLSFLHARDVGLGLTDWFLPGQAELALLALPLAIAGIWFYFLTAEGKRYRLLGWMYVIPLALFVVMRGRDYYLAPGYPMLFAAGAVWVESFLFRPSSLVPHQRTRNIVRRMVWLCLILDVIVAGAVALPIAPVNSRWWNLASQVDTVFPEEIGWLEFAQSVARVRDKLPPEERERVGILAGNYGEVGALNLYGEKFGLPHAMSGVNSSWERGYDDPPPNVLIVVGYSREFLEQEFASCFVAGHVRNRFNVPNEETVEDPQIFVCHGLKEAWPEFWRKARRFA